MNEPLVLISDFSEGEYIPLQVSDAKGELFRITADRRFVWGEGYDQDRAAAALAFAVTALIGRPAETP